MTPAPSTRRRRFVRAEEPAHPLTALKLDALRLIAESRFLSTPQVEALMGISDRAARAHLRDLFDMGLLDVVAVPGIALGGSPFVMAPKVHLPTREGLRTLERLDLRPPGADRPAGYTPAQYAFLAHELSVRDFLVWLTRSSRKHAKAGHLVERWDCGGDLQALSARPDAAFIYQFGPDPEGKGGPAVAGLLEADMGSERGTGENRYDRWAQKIGAYGAVFAEESRDALLSLLGVRRARLVVTVPTPARADWILARAREHPVRELLWVAVRSELEGADVHSAVWQRTNGRWPFVPQTRGGRR